MFPHLFDKILLWAMRYIFNSIMWCRMYIKRMKSLYVLICAHMCVFWWWWVCVIHVLMFHRWLRGILWDERIHFWRVITFWHQTYLILNVVANMMTTYKHVLTTSYILRSLIIHLIRCYYLISLKERDKKNAICHVMVFIAGKRYNLISYQQVQRR